MKDIVVVEGTNRGEDKDPIETDAETSTSTGDDAADVEAAVDADAAGDAEGDEEDKVLTHTTKLGQTTLTAHDISSFESKGYFPTEFGLLDSSKTTPKPREGEVVVFKEFFDVGLRFPCHESVAKILGKYDLQLHHLSLFICAIIYGL